MLKLNDCIVYGLSGVCKVIDIVEETFLNQVPQQFYVLSPVYKPELTIKIPVSMREKVRPLYSKTEVETLIQEIPNHELYWIEDDRKRNETYRGMLREGDTEKWLTLVKTLYSYKNLPDFKTKKFNRNDDEIFEMAQKLLHEELGTVLDVHPNEMATYIQEIIS